MPDYKLLAQQETDPQIEAKKLALQNALAMKLSGYDAQKNTLGTQYNKNVGLANQTYDAQVNNQNLSTQKQQNSYSNSALGRGLGRSTIAQTGTQEIGNIGSRLVGNINTNRGNALQNMLDTYNSNLSNIEGLKTTENANYNNTLAEMEAQRQNQIATLARQLQDSDWEKNYKMQQLALQSSRSSGGSGSGSSGSSKGNPTGDIDEVVNDSKSSYGAKLDALKEAGDYYLSIGDKKSADYAQAQASKLRTDYTVNVYNGYGQSAGVINRPANTVQPPAPPKSNSGSLGQWLVDKTSGLRNSVQSISNGNTSGTSMLKNLYNKITNYNQSYYR